MRFQSLDDWLRWQETLHPSRIALGLDRVQRVLGELGLARLPCPVLTVGGTNGKGSCVAFLESILRAAGYRTGAYLSPHLIRYNERIRIDGREISDRELCCAFERVEDARADTALTYFEFGTLAALDRFAAAEVDVAILEVGMGGRLDAVNAVDPDAAIVVTVGLDHQEWLGSDRELIGREKAGIFRSGRPAICGDREPPASLLEHAHRIGADLRRIGRDFDWQADSDAWGFHGEAQHWEPLPWPALAGRMQLDNAACALAALAALAGRLPVMLPQIRAGLGTASLPGRLQRLSLGAVPVVADVAHNPQAARELARNLRADRWPGRTLGVVGMLADKAVEQVAAELDPVLDVWFAGGTEGERALSGTALATRLKSAHLRGTVRAYDSIAAAFDAAREEAGGGDRLVVFGSFHTVGPVLGGLLDEVPCAGIPSRHGN